MLSELGADLMHVEDRLWIAAAATGVPAYDFDFSSFFAVRRPWHREHAVRAISRLGATGEYVERFERLRDEDRVLLVHDLSEHLRCSQLPHWYPILSDLTPRSLWYDQSPDPDEVERSFAWPIFVKGERQTSRHQRRLSIIENRTHFGEAMRQYQADPILGWQRVVCREYVPPREVGEQSAVTLPRAFEFRTFWWRGQFVGASPYWTDIHYDWTAAEREAALTVAAEAARRVNVTFLGIDVAMTRDDGRWIVIECNDGQDCGYRALSPMLLWRKILDIESGTSAEEAGHR